MKIFIILVSAVLLYAGTSFAETEDANEWQSEVCRDSAAVVADSAKATTENAAMVVNTSFTDTPSAPMAAVGAVTKTGSTVFESADKALKTLTGDKD